MQQHTILTDDSLMETKAHGSSAFPVGYYHENIYDYDFHIVNWHWHHDFQFEFAAKGSFYYVTESERILLREGCGLLINSGVIHRFEADEDAFEDSIIFAPELFGREDSLIYGKYILPFMQEGPSSVFLDPSVPWQKDALDDTLYLSRAFNDTDNPQNEMLLLSHLLSFMDTVIRNSPHDRDKARSSMKASDHHQLQLRQMMQFIYEHFQMNISLSDIANAGAVSKGTAISVFKKSIRQSPAKFLSEYRLRKAAEYLKNTDKTILEISTETGFSESGYFCRKFRESYHMTPGEYRKQHSLHA